MRLFNCTLTLNEVTGKTLEILSPVLSELRMAGRIIEQLEGVD
jgi:hypothetical protein